MTAEANCPKCGGKVHVKRAAVWPREYRECYQCFTGVDVKDEQQAAQLSALTARVAELEGRLADIDAAANADAADLAEMRDGTKLTRAGLVQVIQYQQQDIKEIKGERERMREAMDRARQVLGQSPVECHDIDEAFAILEDALAQPSKEGK
jgi:hypothetical protein